MSSVVPPQIVIEMLSIGTEESTVGPLKYTSNYGITAKPHYIGKVEEKIIGATFDVTHPDESRDFTTTTRDIGESGSATPTAPALVITENSPTSTTEISTTMNEIFKSTSTTEALKDVRTDFPEKITTSTSTEKVTENIITTLAEEIQQSTTGVEESTIKNTTAKVTEDITENTTTVTTLAEEMLQSTTETGKLTVQSTMSTVTENIMDSTTGTSAHNLQNNYSTSYFENTSFFKVPTGTRLNDTFTATTESLSHSSGTTNENVLQNTSTEIVTSSSAYTTEEALSSTNTIISKNTTPTFTTGNFVTEKIKRGLNATTESNSFNNTTASLEKDSPEKSNTVYIVFGSVILVVIIIIISIILYRKYKKWMSLRRGVYRPNQYHLNNLNYPNSHKNDSDSRSMNVRL